MATIISRLQEAVQSIIQGTLDTAKASPVTTALIVVPSLYLFIKSLPRFLSRGKVQLYHSSPSLTIPLRSGSTTTLASIIEPLLPPCNLNPLLFNGDLQTIAVQATSHGVPIHYKRRIFEGDDPIYSGTFAVDFVVPPASTPSETQSNAAATKTDNLPPRTTYFTAPQWQTLSTGSSDTRPMLIILHGLSGGSHEVYLRAFLDPLVPSDTHPTRDSGWEACVLIARGCSRTRVTSPILYNARATWDLRQLVKFLRLKYPNRPLFAAGFSLGGNILVNYLGEEGEKCEIQAAVVFSSVWNMEVAARALQRSWFKMEVYNRALGSSMKKLFRRHEEMITKVKGIDREEVLGLRYLFEFDRYVQCPTWGYPTEAAYYRDASSIDTMMSVRVPVLAFHSLDDPVVCDEVLPYEEVKVTPYVVLCTTSLGGHLGWFERGGGRWFVGPSVGFLQKLATEVKLDEVSRTEMGKLTGNVEHHGKKPMVPVFEPTRRKLHFRNALSAVYADSTDSSVWAV